MPRSELTTVLRRAREIHDYVQALTDDERNYLLDLLLPEQEPAPKKSTKKRGRKPAIPLCVACGYAEASIVHKDQKQSDYHVFQPPKGKSKRAGSIQSAIQGTPKPATCTFIVNDADGEKCGALQDDPIHDRTYISSHEFQPKGAAKAAGGE